MNKFKVGDKVKILKESALSENTIGMIGCIAQVDESDIVVVDVGNSQNCYNITKLEFDTKYQVGDVLVSDEYERKVLAVVTISEITLFILSSIDDFAHYDNRLWTVNDIDYLAYTLKNTTKDEVQEAIKVLEKHGKIKDGKILNN